MPALDFLNRRLSVASRQLGEPAPTPAQLEQLLAAAIRVPDHGKLEPFRLLLIHGEMRARLGAELAAIHQRKEPEVPPAVLEKDRQRFSFAPLIVAVIARIQANHPKVLVQEQILCAGLVAYNLLLGAQALGFGAQWLTGWSAYDRDAATLLGLAEHERVVAYVHIGTPRDPAPERTRPALTQVVTEWHGA